MARRATASLEVSALVSRLAREVQGTATASSTAASYRHALASAMARPASARGRDWCKLTSTLGRRAPGFFLRLLSRERARRTRSGELEIRCGPLLLGQLRGLLGVG